MNSELSQEEIERGKQWFDWYVHSLENHSVIKPAQPGIVYGCPCCNYKTLDQRGGVDICPVCFWEDDGQDDEDADVVRGGPNGLLSLTQARANYRAFGACETRVMEYVRKPLAAEM